MHASAEEALGRDGGGAEVDEGVVDNDAVGAGREEIRSGEGGEHGDQGIGHGMVTLRRRGQG